MGSVSVSVSHAPWSTPRLSDKPGLSRCTPERQAANDDAAEWFQAWCKARASLHTRCARGHHEHGAAAEAVGLGLCPAVAQRGEAAPAAEKEVVQSPHSSELIRSRSPGAGPRNAVL